MKTDAPNQLPERLEVESFVEPSYELLKESVRRYNSHTALVAERDEAERKLRISGWYGDEQMMKEFKWVAALIRERDELKRQVRIQQESLERKNRELDSMHYVWCDGGCETGVHRWDKSEVTEEIVALAEKNVQRLRVWFNNYKHRKSLTHYDPKS